MCLFSASCSRAFIFMNTIRMYRNITCPGLVPINQEIFGNLTQDIDYEELEWCSCHSLFCHRFCIYNIMYIEQIESVHIKQYHIKDCTLQVGIIYITYSSWDNDVCIWCECKFSIINALQDHISMDSIKATGVKR